MEAGVTAVFIANAGVLIEYGKIRLLFDGIHWDESERFDRVPACAWDQMRRGRGRFANAEYLFFSHFHSDHFNWSMLMEYLRNNRVRRVFLPDPGEELRIVWRECIEKTGAKATFLQASSGRVRVYEIGDAFVGAFWMRHDGKRYAHIKNYCFIFSANGTNLLFTGDADCGQWKEAPLPEKTTLDGVFLNPLYLITQKGREAVSGRMRPERAVIYHVPGKAFGMGSYGRLIQQNLERFQWILPPMTLLDAPFQELLF